HTYSQLMTKAGASLSRINLTYSQSTKQIGRTCDTHLVMPGTSLLESFLDECAGTHSLALSKADLPQVEEGPDQILLILHLPVILLALLQQRTSLRVVVLADGGHAEKMEQVGQISCVSSIPGDRRALLQPGEPFRE